MSEPTPYEMYAAARRLEAMKALDSVSQTVMGLLMRIDEITDQRDAAEAICEELEHFENDTETPAQTAIETVRKRAWERVKAMKAARDKLFAQPSK